MLKSNLRLGPNGPELTSTLTGVNGTRALGGYRLEMQFDWLPHRWTEFADVRAMVGGELEVSFGGQHFPAAQLKTRYGVAFADGNEFTHPANVELTAYLGDRELNELERLRSGGEILLYLRLQGVRTGPAETGPHPETFWGELEYRLSAAEWAEVLHRWGYAETFLLQVPIASGEQSIAAVKASRELDTAIEDMAQGRYREAIAKCRDTLEGAYENDKNRFPDLKYSIDGAREMTKEERFWLIRRGAWSVAHAAKHRDSTAAAIEWERRDAESLIRIVAAMLEQDPPL